MIETIKRKIWFKDIVLDLSRFGQHFIRVAASSENSTESQCSLSENEKLKLIIVGLCLFLSWWWKSNTLSLQTIKEQPNDFNMNVFSCSVYFHFSWKCLLSIFILAEKSHVPWLWTPQCWFVIVATMLWWHAKTGLFVVIHSWIGAVCFKLSNTIRAN